MIGIIGYGAYVPCYRIRTDEIALQWGRDPQTVKQGLALREKTVYRLRRSRTSSSVMFSTFDSSRG